MNKVISVSQINTYIKSLLDGSDILQHLYITGEISNLAAHYKSGHMYLSLKDERAVLKAVMFAQAAKRLRFAPKDGMKVLARGRITVYEATGQYQLYIDDMQPDGLGALNLAYEQLKERLANEGLFAAEIKRPLPDFPEKIGVITSPTGAAVQDIFNILSRRWPMAQVLFAPCTVQGENAVPELLAALKRLNEKTDADVIILGRGGGSLEDLWAFNDEGLARAVRQSRIPVVSAVGHETDFTICDFVADLRAATPSAAAELVTPDIFEQQMNLAVLTRRLKAAVYQKTNDGAFKLDSMPPIRLLGKRMLRDKRETLATAVRLLPLLSGKRTSVLQTQLSQMSGRLDALSPLKVLSRGYALVTAAEKPLKSILQVHPGDELKARVADGTITATIVRSEKHGEI